MVFFMDIRLTHLEESRVRNIRFLRVTVILNEKIMFVFCFSQPDKIDYGCRILLVELLARILFIRVRTAVCLIWQTCCENETIYRGNVPVIVENDTRRKDYLSVKTSRSLNQQALKRCPDVFDSPYMLGGISIIAKRSMHTGNDSGPQSIVVLNR